jgi:tetraacyldisaccharide 4'-kinase
LSRGYGSAGGANDEALLLDEHLPDVPHLIGADRVAAAQTAIDELESNVLVLDDGFQHRRLERTLDLVLIDATEPWGIGYCLPRGLLRESPAELKRADAILLTRCDLVGEDRLNAIAKRIARLAPDCPVFESEHRPMGWVNGDGCQIGINELKDRRGIAFCGVGNPAAFFQTLEAAGVKVTDHRIYSDHYRYSKLDVDDLERWAENQPHDIVIFTTEKDLVKLRIAQLGGRPLWALKIGLNVRKNEGKFKDLLDRVLD